MPIPDSAGLCDSSNIDSLLATSEVIKQSWRSKCPSFANLVWKLTIRNIDFLIEIVHLSDHYNGYFKEA